MKYLPHILLGIIVFPWMIAFPFLLVLLLPWVLTTLHRRQRRAADAANIERLSAAFRAKHAPAAVVMPAPVPTELLVRGMLRD